jgi:plasmid replication initiation protein
MGSKSLVVVKHNKVIGACYQLSLSEQRIVLACIAQIDSKVDLSVTYKFAVTVDNIQELAGVKNAYDEIKEASVKLLKRVIRIDNPDPDDLDLPYTLTHWVDSCDYYPKKGKVVLSFSRRIIPYLSQISKNYTQYKITNVAKMKSAYSIRLYELLCQWLSTGKKDVSVDWLREYWQLTDSYGKMCDLKRWVIDVSVREINEHSNIWVKYSQRKAGRTITNFIFEFGLKEAEKTTRTKANGTRPLIPIFTGHPEYKEDTNAILEVHERLKKKPGPKPKKIMDSDKKSKITGLKRAIKQMESIVD